MNLNKKVALITGGTKGIGFSIAENMLAQGMLVMITGRTQNSVDSVVKEFEQKYPNQIKGLESDVRNMDDMQKVVDEIEKDWGQLDVVIANAGIGHFASIEELDATQWNETIDVNLTGVFNTIKSGLDLIIKNKGYIITIASLAGTNFFARGAAYNASKFGLVGFTQAIMLDLRKHDVKCSTIMPGSVSTYFNGRTPSDEDSWKIQPEDIGQMVIDLLKMNPRTLPSKIEVRPTKPPSK